MPRKRQIMRNPNNYGTIKKLSGNRRRPWMVGVNPKINDMGTTILVVTHEKELVNAFAKRVITIDSGRIVSDGMDGYYSYEIE